MQSGGGRSSIKSCGQGTPTTVEPTNTNSESINSSNPLVGIFLRNKERTTQDFEINSDKQK